MIPVEPTFQGCTFGCLLALLSSETLISLLNGVASPFYSYSLSNHLQNKCI
jgi:hypothetical protein